MVMTYCLILGLICLKVCLCVTSPNAVANMTNIQKWNSSNEEIKELSKALRILTEHFGKLNYFHLSQTEPRLMAVLTTLTHIDSNVKHLQERAHVWDTFQHHISAWNDQLSTSDRKLDIINKAQQDILSLEDKVNSFYNIEYKIDKILKQLNVLEDNFNNVNRKIENTPLLHDSLFSEFAARGMLSTLKDVERKVDKLFLLNPNTKSNYVRTTTEDAKRKLTIKCNTPPTVENLLQDVASKVDVIFDKMANSNHGREYVDDEDYPEDQDFITNMNLGTNVEGLTKAFKKLDQSLKQIKKGMDQLDDTVFIVYNTSALILENSDELKQMFQKYFSLNLPNNLRKAMENLFNNITKTMHEQTLILKNYTSIGIANQNKIADVENNKHQTCINNDDSGSNTQYHNNSLPIPKQFVNLTRYSTNESSCDDLEFGFPSGVYNLVVDVTNSIATDYTYYTRYCEVTENTTWTVIQNRDNYESIQNFSLDWNSYKTGFGNLHFDFWFGNDFIRRLSTENNLTLRIELEDFEGNKAWAEYDQFKVATEAENYKLTIGGYSGNASDSFSGHNNSLFSTFDIKNDDAPDCCPCAESYGGGWWFNSCFESNLNGIYYSDSYNRDQYRGIIWQHWRGDYSLKKTKMMVKKKKIFEDGHMDTVT